MSINKRFMIVALSIFVICVIAVAKIQKPKQIVTLDVASIINTFVIQQNNQSLSEEQVNKTVDAFSQKLTKVINQAAKAHNYVIVPKQAVIAGSTDITTEIRQQVLGMD